MKVIAQPVSRRQVLSSAAAIATCVSLPARCPLALGAPLPATPACHDQDEPTVASVEGPFFEPNSPQRADLVEPDSAGHLVLLTGRVISPACQALAGVLIDLWHADENGQYDMRGYRYRGHVFTDANGGFRFRTIEPAVYPGRTRHFHVKVQAPSKPLLTTQLFFPGEPRNQSDWLFRQQLLLSVQDTHAQMSAQFEFVLDV